MRTISINNRKDYDDAPRRMLRNDPGGICAHADYDRDHYVFLRAQTREMQMMEWENRMAPIRHWGSNLFANIAWEIFA